MAVEAVVDNKTGLTLEVEIAQDLTEVDLLEEEETIEEEVSNMRHKEFAVIF